MSKVDVEVPPEIPRRIAEFELQNHMKRRARRMKTIQDSIDRLGLSDDDIAAFDDAREAAWTDRKDDLL